MLQLRKKSLFPCLVSQLRMKLLRESACLVSLGAELREHFGGSLIAAGHLLFELLDFHLQLLLQPLLLGRNLCQRVAKLLFSLD